MLLERFYRVYLAAALRAGEASCRKHCEQTYILSLNLQRWQIKGNKESEALGKRRNKQRYEMKPEMAVKARKASYSFRNKKAEAGKTEHNSLQCCNIYIYIRSITFINTIVSHFPSLFSWLAQLFQIQTPEMQNWNPNLASDGSSKHQPHQFSVLITLKMFFFFKKKRTQVRS